MAIGKENVCRVVVGVNTMVDLYGLNLNMYSVFPKLND